jgi:predicted RNA polymerase sigma factor
MTTPPKQRVQQLSRFTCWHPLLPAFSARIIIAFRVLLGIAVSKIMKMYAIDKKKSVILI